MHTTKIIRRIDELGRIVVPKEIRRTLKIRANDTLEIYSEGDVLTLKKYSPYHNEYDTCVCLAVALKSVINKEVIITDTHKVICSSIAGVEGCVLNQKLLDLSGRSVVKEGDIIQPISEKNFDYFKQTITPIFNGELIGYLIVMGEKEDNEKSECVKLATEFLAQKLG